MTLRDKVALYERTLIEIACVSADDEERAIMADPMSEKWDGVAKWPFAFGWMKGVVKRQAASANWALSQAKKG